MLSSWVPPWDKPGAREAQYCRFCGVELTSYNDHKNMGEVCSTCGPEGDRVWDDRGNFTSEGEGV